MSRVAPIEGGALRTAGEEGENSSATFKPPVQRFTNSGKRNERG